MELLFWPLLGAAIGVYAAQKKGFSTVGGVIGGMLLGPLAFLLFFVTGIVSGKEQQRKCPYCAEWIRPDATVCKHCHKDLPPLQTTVPPRRRSLVAKVALVLGAILITLVILVALMMSGPTISRLTTPLVTAAEFNGLQTGITYEQAVQIIGAPGEEISRSDLAGMTTIMYQWKNGDGSNMNAMFQNGRLVNKAQFGLR